MALPTALLTGTFPMPDDTAFPDATLIFRLSGMDANDAAGLADSEVVVALGSGGAIPNTAKLFQNIEGISGSFYRLSLRYKVTTTSGVFYYKTVFVADVSVGADASYSIGDLLFASQARNPEPVQVTHARGADLGLDVQWLDEAGPVDLTGVVLSAFETIPAALGADILVTVTDADAGEFTIAIPWSDNWPSEMDGPRANGLGPLVVVRLQGSNGAAINPITVVLI